MSELSTTATGLRFPGGPVVMKDGSFILGDDRAPDRHTRVHGWQHRGPRLHSGGPNGLGIGPDAAIHVCNNGGFSW